MIAAGGGATRDDVPARPLRVDAHHHVWDLDVREQAWAADLPTLQRSFSFDDLRPDLAANHIDRTVVVQTVCGPDETPELLELAHNTPQVSGVVGWVDLGAPDVADRLASLSEGQGGDHLVGVRHHVQDEPDPDWLRRPDVRRGLRAVGEAGLVYDLLVRHYQLPAVIDTVAALDEVRFVLDHGGKPDIANGVIQPWNDQLISLSRFPNVAVKLSGLVTEADHQRWTFEQIRPYADVVVGAFGARRTMWGSDWPVCLLAACYEEVVASAEGFTASMSAAERADVFGGTALTWYSLEEAP
jgi:L-fuconolactonase